MKLCVEPVLFNLNKIQPKDKAVYILKIKPQTIYNGIQKDNDKNDITIFKGTQTELCTSLQLPLDLGFQLNF